jgi:hypothetical protein
MQSYIYNRNWKVILIGYSAVVQIRYAPYVNSQITISTPKKPIASVPFFLANVASVLTVIFLPNKRQQVLVTFG